MKFLSFLFFSLFQMGVFAESVYPKLFCNKSNYKTYIFNKAKTDQLIKKTGRGCQLQNMVFDYSVFRDHLDASNTVHQLYLKKANLSGSKFTGASPGSRTSSLLSTLNFAGPNFEEANLTGVQFNFVSIRNGKMAGSELTGTQFHILKIISSDLKFARVKTGQWNQAILPEGQAIKIKAPNLRFSPAKTARWHKVNLTGSDLKGADLSGVSSYKNIWKNTSYNNATKLPKGLNPQKEGMTFISDSDSKLFCNHGNYKTYIFNKAKTDQLLKETNRGCWLKNIVLKGLTLQDADLRLANLEGADLRKADLSRAKLWRANLKKANLERATLTSADLKASTLIKANLKFTDLMGADFTAAKLMFADLTGAKVALTIFNNANLNTAILKGIQMSETSFNRAKMQRVDLSGSTYEILLPTVATSSPSSMDYALQYDFSKTNPLPVNLQGANTLPGRNTLHTSFWKADLRGANLSNLSSIVSPYTLKSGALLKGLYLKEAIYNNNTTFPSDLSPEKHKMKLMR